MRASAPGRVVVVPSTAGGPAALTLRLGQEVAAEVLAVQPGRVLLSLAGRRIWAETDAALYAGETLRLQVVDATARRLRLRIVTPLERQTAEAAGRQPLTERDVESALLEIGVAPTPEAQVVGRALLQRGVGLARDRVMALQAAAREGAGSAQENLETGLFLITRGLPVTRAALELARFGLFEAAPPADYVRELRRATGELAGQPPQPEASAPAAGAAQPAATSGEDARPSAAAGSTPERPPAGVRPGPAEAQIASTGRATSGRFDQPPQTPATSIGRPLLAPSPGDTPLVARPGALPWNDAPPAAPPAGAWPDGGGTRVPPGAAAPAPLPMSAGAPTSAPANAPPITEPLPPLAPSPGGTAAAPAAGESRVSAGQPAASAAGATPARTDLPAAFEAPPEGSGRPAAAVPASGLEVAPPVGSARRPPMAPAARSPDLPPDGVDADRGVIDTAGGPPASRPSPTLAPTAPPRAAGVPMPNASAPIAPAALPSASASPAVEVSSAARPAAAGAPPAAGGPSVPQTAAAADALTGPRPAAAGAPPAAGGPSVPQTAAAADALTGPRTPDLPASFAGPSPAVQSGPPAGLAATTPAVSSSSSPVASEPLARADWPGPPLVAEPEAAALSRAVDALGTSLEHRLLQVLRGELAPAELASDGRVGLERWAAALAQSARQVPAAAAALGSREDQMSGSQPAVAEAHPLSPTALARAEAAARGLARTLEFQQLQNAGAPAQEANRFSLAIPIAWGTAIYTVYLSIEREGDRRARRPVAEFAPRSTAEIRVELPRLGAVDATVQLMGPAGASALSGEGPGARPRRASTAASLARTGEGWRPPPAEEQEPGWRVRCRLGCPAGPAHEALQAAAGRLEGALRGHGLEVDWIRVEAVGQAVPPAAGRSGPVPGYRVDAQA